MFYKMVSVFSLLVLAGLVYAGGEEGTGSAIQVAIDGGQRMVVTAQQDGIDLIGSSEYTDTYSELVIDGLSSDGQLYPAWGKAEVLLGCYQADVLLYQQQQTEWIEVAALRLVTAYCPAQ